MLTSPVEHLGFGGKGDSGVSCEMNNIPIGSMYGIFTHIWHKFMVNVGRYTIHGSYGIE